MRGRTFPPGRVDAVVVLSGGQDSATALALATRRHGAERVAAITFAYGQRHALEVKYARTLATRVFKVAAWKTLPLAFFSKITDNALLSKEAPIRRRAGAKCPNTVVEGRNAVFLQIASVWAKTLGAKEVWIGVSEADSSGYPDCRASFIRAQERAIRLALDFPIRIVAPFLRMTKAEEWALAEKLGILDVIENQTLTCYNGIPGRGCGRCPACRLRKEGYRQFMSRRAR